VIVRPLYRGLARPLFRALSGAVSAITKVLIDLSPTSGGFYSLGTPQVFAGDFDFRWGYVTTASSVNQTVLSSGDVADFLRLKNIGDPSTRSLSVRISNNEVEVPINFGNDGKFNNFKVTRVGSLISVYLNNLLQGTVNTAWSGNSFTINEMGRLSSNNLQAFEGIISDVKLTDITTPANSLEFKLDQLTANTETNNGVTLTYQNIGTGTSVRGTYTLIDGDYFGSELVVNGDFATNSDWSAPTGVTIENGKAEFLNVTNNASFIQNNVVADSGTYVISVEVSGYSSGGVFIRLPFEDNTTQSSNGTLIVEGQVNGSGSLFIRASGVTTLDVDNVSVKRKIEVA
jgi:hypothetical protein